MNKNTVIHSFSFLRIHCTGLSLHKQLRLRFFQYKINRSWVHYLCVRWLKFFTALLFAVLLPVAALTLLSSCTGKTDGMLHGDGSRQKKKLTRSILLVLGKDFYQYSDIFSYLTEVYSPESLKAKLSIVSYSDMTVKTKQPRLSVITDRLAAAPADVLISLGIPEGGAKILRTIKEKSPAQHIFSLLPVEEILPLEAYSDIVVDFELPDAFTKADRAVHIPASDKATLILCAVTAAEQLDELPDQEPFPRFARAIASAAAMLKDLGIPAWGGTQYVLAPYLDPELNIRSYNYLILSQPLAEGASTEAALQQGEVRE